MIHRQQCYAIRSVIMNHQKTMQAWVGSVSNKHISSEKLRLGACISSRITSVIHIGVDHQINYNCFNEPFADSSDRNLILTHAWLNRWNKHMTTGRINQVVTSENCKKWHHVDIKFTNYARKTKCFYKYVFLHENFFSLQTYISKKINEVNFFP